MNKTSQSILLAAMLAASGFAAAQNPAVPATCAEVKSEAGTAERKAGTGEVAKSGGTTVSASTAERKRMRDERRAMNKANREAKMKMGSTPPPALVSEKAP